jgi:hypothetical protein
MFFVPRRLLLRGGRRGGDGLRGGHLLGCRSFFVHKMQRGDVPKLNRPVKLLGLPRRLLLRNHRALRGVSGVRCGKVCRGGGQRVQLVCSGAHFGHGCTVVLRVPDGRLRRGLRFCQLHKLQRGDLQPQRRSHQLRELCRGQLLCDHGPVRGDKSLSRWPVLGCGRLWVHCLQRRPLPRFERRNRVRQRLRGGHLLGCRSFQLHELQCRDLPVRGRGQRVRRVFCR